MRAILTLSTLLASAAPAAAQVEPGDILLTSLSPDKVLHYRPDGTLVQTADVGTGTFWVGAGLLPDGSWITSHRHSAAGLNVFDGINGVETASFDVPGLSRPGDLGVRSDGTIVQVDEDGTLFHLDRTGTLLHTWAIPSAVQIAGLAIDDQDHAWVCDYIALSLHHVDEHGTLVSSIPLGFAPGDAVSAPDGTLWISDRDGFWVWHYARDGNVLGFFKTVVRFGFLGVGLGSDGTFWLTGVDEKALFHYDQAGLLLDVIFIDPLQVPFFLMIADGSRVIGTNYCGPATQNSSGQPGVITATGSTKVALNIVTLTASQLPPGMFGYFLNSDVQGFTPLPPGSEGNLCLAGGIGRHVKQIAQSDSAGELVIQIDLTALPRPGGAHAVLAGETWNFQCWFRDKNPGATSNFTDGTEIAFQ